MNVSLIGYRGTGKTTIASRLAAAVGYTLRNLDALIVEKAGKAIPEIVAAFGWDRFRDLESEVLAEAVRGDRQVLDCGGGVILREANRKLLKAAGPVIWLVADVPAIIERIQQDDQRPSLTGRSFTDEVVEVLSQREPLYRAAADHVINTCLLTPDQAAAEIARLAGLAK